MRLPTPGDIVFVDGHGPYRVFHGAQRDGFIILGVIHRESGQADEFVFSTAEFLERIEFAETLAQRFHGERLTRDKFELAVEALRLRSAHHIDPLFAVNVSQIDLLPHQADAVYRHILHQPRIRFLLADDPGLGKTIMAGLVLKELRARAAVERCLVVAPAHLCEQWKRELSDWFQEDFLILERSLMTNATSPAFFDRNRWIITSLDFAKHERRRDLLSQLEWDLVVFDEAHKLSAKRVGREISRTRRYQLGEALAPKARHLLFLTATPHSGDETDYHLLLDLLEPRLFANATHLRDAAHENRGLPFVLRRSKEQVTDLAGNRLFRKRTVETLQLTMTAAERAVYDGVTEYVTNWYPYTADLDWLSGRRRRNIALALTVLQRRVGSGMRAIRLSLDRRRSKLQRLESEWARIGASDDDLIELDSDEGLAEIDDQRASEWEQLQERLEGVSAAVTLEELRAEIAELAELITMVRRVEQAGTETKLTELRSVVQRWLAPAPDEKLLIFSEFRDTVEYLRQQLESWGLTVAMIHGGQDMDERRRQERYFRDSAQVMVATDAAAEGINLQFCHLMINYDLPWNPNRLEQRMGRIHRYGQQRDCSIWNLLYGDTREGDILARLLVKIDRMRARPELGDTIYDVISVVLAGINLERLIMDAVTDKSVEDIGRLIEVDVDKLVAEFIKLLRDNALASQYIDLSVVRRFVDESNTAGVGPHDIERFVRNAVELMGGGLEQDRQRRDGVFRLGIPQDHQREYISAGYSPGMRVAFDRIIARAEGVTYIAPGHPIFERLLLIAPPTQQGPYVGVLSDPGGVDGTLWLYRLKAKDGTEATATERLEAFFRRACDGHVEVVPATRIRDLREGPRDIYYHREALSSIEEMKSSVETYVLSRLSELLAEIQDRRAREAAIKRQWVIDSYSTLIGELDQRLQGFMSRQRMGERNLGGQITLAERDKHRLEQERSERLRTLDTESRLMVLAPQLEAVALVIAS